MNEKELAYDNLQGSVWSALEAGWTEEQIKACVQAAIEDKDAE